MVSLQRGDFDFAAKSCLRKRNGNHAMEVGSFTLEEGMLFHMQHDVEIAGRPTEITSFSQTGVADASAVFHPGGNLGLDLTLFEYAAFPPAFGAGIRYHSTGTLTRAAGAGNTEKTLLIAHLAPSTATCTSDRSFTGSGA